MWPNPIKSYQISPISPNLTESHRISPTLLNLTESLRISLNLTKSHHISLNLTISHRISQNVAKSHWISPNLAISHQIISNLTEILGSNLIESQRISLNCIYITESNHILPYLTESCHKYDLTESHQILANLSNSH